MPFVPKSGSCNQSSISQFIFSQTSPSASWVVIHELGRFPIVSIINSSNEEIEGQIIHDSINKFTISFDTSISGKAICI